ncbi:hypothetical protein TRAPUB_3249 [Trametes pubescens]|uniref:F-box domain-containing protein n=1 Tax=Trametes pubescens TaxID=154538 RepID=A0A1M2VE56_TRAPU|nr:hypothetical protein TRAPUB_3249 [Trametes pubescens]
MNRRLQIQEADVPGTNSETWGRFLQYAAFVRGVRLLVLKTSHEDPARDLFTLLLKRRHGHSFLPELRELNLNVIGGLESAHVFILSSLASPTVTALGIHSSFGCEEESRHLLHGGLAETVTKAFPGIFSLQISLLGEAIEDPSRMVADLAISDPHFAPYLRKLSIHAPVDRQYAVNLLPPPQRRTLTDILHPLSALKHLEDVSFTMDFYRRFLCLTPNISDDDIRAVAAALRRVRRIELLLKNPAPLESPPTLRSLVHFATLCPQLVSLSLSQVDIDSAIPSTSPSDGPVRCDTLRILRLVDPSPATEPRRIAACLHRLFPHLDVAGCAFANDSGQSAVVQDEMRLLQQVSENHN